MEKRLTDGLGRGFFGPVHQGLSPDWDQSAVLLGKD